MTVVIMQHVILLNPTSTTVLVMMVLLEMVCTVKVGVPSIYPVGMIYDHFTAAIDPCQLNNGDCEENESCIYEGPGMVYTLESYHFTV